MHEHRCWATPCSQRHGDHLRLGAGQIFVRCCLPSDIVDVMKSSKGDMPGPADVDDAATIRMRLGAAEILEDRSATIVSRCA